MIAKDALRNLGLALSFVLLVTFGLREVAPGARNAPDFDGSARGPEVVIHIEPGMTGSQVGEVLERESVVKSALAYFRAAVANSESKRIAPGEHRVETQIPAAEAVMQLLDPNRIVDLVRVRDGARLSEVVDALAEAGFEKKKISKALSNLKPPLDFKLPSVEGLLYPAFYSFPRGTNEEGALSAMLSRFQQSTSDLNWRFEDFSKEELLIISSLVESEGTPDVFAKVARVIYNRLDKGMKLQFDSTVHYVFNRRGEIALSLKDTQVRNRYNTFVYGGLPPGPIGSPTRAAIEAR